MIYKLFKKRNLILFAVLIAMLLKPIMAYAQSGEPSKNFQKQDLAKEQDKVEKQDGVQENDPIHVVSDRMEVDMNRRIVDFMGNIHLTSSDSVITADQLKVYYKEGGFTGKGEDGGSTEESIDKLVAIGNVVINFDNRVAVADHAVYTADNGILVLTGKEANITSDNNTISGEKITLHRRDGRVFVESSSKERVRAVLENKKDDSVSTD